MSITFRCKCGKALKVPEVYAGKRAKCNACGQTLTIPNRRIPGTEEKTEARATELFMCMKCGHEFPGNEIIKDDGCILCRECSKALDTSDHHSRHSKKLVLFGGMCVVLIIVGSVVSYFAWFKQPPEERWPFVTEIPEGFEFERKQEWEGRTIWILKGAELGQAHRTLIVVRSIPGAVSHDVTRAPYWAVELSVDLSVGESIAGRIGWGEATVYSISRGDQMVFSPSRVFWPTTSPGRAGESPPSLTGGPPGIPTDFLGKPDGFEPEYLEAWSGIVRGTLLLAACSGEHHWYSGNSADTDMLLDLCIDLRQEPGEEYEPWKE